MRPIRLSVPLLPRPESRLFATLRMTGGWGQKDTILTRRGELPYVFDLLVKRHEDSHFPAAKRTHVKKSGWTLLGFVFIGGLLGRVLGEILKEFSSAGPIQTIFAESISTGVHPPLTVDLVLIAITLGFLLKLNLLTLLGIVFGYYLHKNL